MHKTITAALVTASLLSLAACNSQPSAADGGINGTWKADIASLKIDTKPDDLLLKDGTYSCSSCTPPLTVAADGAFHPVTGLPYADSVSIKVDDDHTVTRTAMKGDQVVGSAKMAVSDDGNTLTIDFTDSSVPGATPVTGELTETRSAPAPAGAHAISGSWTMNKYNNVSEDGLTITYALDGDTLHVSSPSGTSFDANLDGTPAPITGDIAGTTVSVTKTGDNSYRLTDSRDGKAVSTSDITVDGDVLHVANKNEVNGSSAMYDMKKM